MPKPLTELGRRERQIMDILVRRKRASAADVLADLPDQPSYSAVRGMLRLLEDKGYVKHEWDGPRHVYLPAANPEHLQRAAVKHLVETFFNDSAESAVVALLGQSGKPLSTEQLDRLEKLIARAKKNGGRL
jgi:BlaI family transcriptional regulator, penicillinase repressor